MPEDVTKEVPKEHEGQSFLSREELHLGEAPSEAVAKPEQVPERKEGKFLELLAKVTPTKGGVATDDDHEDTLQLDAKHISEMTDETSKVKKLVVLAETKGVVHAVKVARSLKDYYALDSLHDELAGELYQGLLERGLVEKD